MPVTPVTLTVDWCIENNCSGDGKQEERRPDTIEKREKKREREREDIVNSYEANGDEGDDGQERGTERRANVTS